MIRNIVKDTFFLSQKSAPATVEDLPIAVDLVDTLRANRAVCVGMAANMIGSLKRIIIASIGPVSIVMINPVILAKKNPYTTKEGCLSLTGQRETTRYRDITVTYLDMSMKPHTASYKGDAAQIIQHEIDHCDGIII